jgi:hypothetical protein
MFGNSNSIERLREVEELLRLHDSLEEGLPEVPRPLYEYARSKARVD